MRERPIVYEVIPHVGVGPVKLGMTRQDVRTVMPGPCESFLKAGEILVDAFHDCGFQVFYAEGETGPTAEFIELSARFDFRAIYRGIDIFATPADQVLAHVSVDAPFDPDDPEFGYSYIFHDLDLALWRPVIQSAPDEPEGREFSTIGVGIADYFRGPL